MSAIRDEKHKQSLVLRLKRIEGQLRGIQAMIEAGDSCERVVQQLSASRSALDKAFFNVIACAIEAEGASAKPSSSRKLAADLLARFG